jgi:light-regulated signal transduction histidine kinase (bacteriophytochrome)
MDNFPLKRVKGNLLVVDDDLLARQTMDIFLTREGYKVRCAPNGEMALMLAREDSPELILLDIRLPDMNGFEVCRRLKKDPQTGHIPVIFISGLEEVADKVKGFEAGGVDYITKSFQREEVLARLETHLALRRLQKQIEAQNVQLQQEIAKSKSAEEALADRTAQLERINRELIALNAELDDFTNMASHDMQEPLRTLMAFSDLLRKDLGDSLSEQAAKDLTFITDAAKRMQALIQDLLALSRAGRAPQKKEKVSLRECADLALEALAMRVKETGAQIIHDKLPDVWGDSTLLTQLYQNLISNALKFSGDQRPMIQLTFEERAGTQVFGVKDNGIGIEPNYAREVFKPFRRLHGRAEYEGSGVGLAICRKIVDRHGGKIWVESEPGKGAHFRFTFPHRTKER